MRKHLGFALAATLAFAMGCSGGSSDDDGDDDSSSIDAGSNAGADAGSQDWETLIAADWQMPNAPDEGYTCATHTLTETIYVGGFRPIAPLGTHHTVVSFGNSNEPDNPGFDCEAFTENPQWIYASGVGTGELILPEGVGMVLEAGTQVHVNLHLFNATEGGISGRSGVEIIRLDQSEVVHEAELFLAGPVNFNDSTPPYEVNHTCTIGATQTIFAIFPHMHQKGQHFFAEVDVGGQTTTIWNEDYDFETQEFVLLPNQLTLNQGDTIRSRCTYSGPVQFGESTTTEMCFAILMRYPRLNAGGGLTGVLCPF